MSVSVTEVYDRQRQYCDTVRGDGLGADMIAGEAFVLSMRKLGYRNAATAANEIIDNSIEARAGNVHVAFGYGEESDAKPEQIAFLDDGYGMIPEMVAAAARWGGTDRHGSRELFGRFGFGLPSASVSQGRAFSVYSRVDDGKFYAVTIDVDGIVRGKYSTKGRVVAPEAEATELPGWIVDYAEKNFRGGLGAVRTVVVWSKFDALTWKTTKALETNFLQRFGVVYRGYLRSVTLIVNTKRVEAIDPLFVTEGLRYFEPLPDGAEPLPGSEIDVKDDATGAVSRVRVRYAFIPFTFLDGSKGRGASPARARFQIRKENNGLIITRNGRQVDVISRGLPINIQNNMRYVGVEVDFPAELDDEFGITTSKQQVTLSDRMILHLEQAGVFRSMLALENRYRHERKEYTGKGFEPEPGEERTSERVMEDVAKITPHKPRTQRQEEQAEENFLREVERSAGESGVDPRMVAEQKKTEALHRPFKVELQKMTEGPFYRAELRGGQLVLILNTAHRFYTDLYAQLSGYEGLRVRAGLELLLFVLGQCETEASTDGQIWYQSERVDWSRKLTSVLTKLEEHAELIEYDDEEGDLGEAV